MPDKVDIRLVDVTRSEEKVLSFIAMNGPAIGYVLHKHAGLSPKTAYVAPKSLMEKGLLELTLKGKTRARLDIKEYSLSVRGLAVAFSLKNIFENVSSVAEQWYSVLPLVLGKWSLFVDEDIEDVALRKLGVAAAHHVIGWNFHLFWESLFHSSDPAEVFTHRFYDPFLRIEEPEERYRWATTCAKDPEIRDYFTERLGRIIMTHKSSAREAENIMAVLQKEEDTRLSTATDVDEAFKT